MSSAQFREAGPPALIKERFVLFLYGVAVHLGLGLLLLHFAVLAMILSPSISILAIACSGGVAVSAWMGGLLCQTLRKDGGRNFRVITGAGLRGMLATTSVMVFLSVVEAIAMSSRLNSTHGWSGVSSFYLILLDASTYGMGRVPITLPFAFVYGTIAGCYILWIAKQKFDSDYILEASSKRSVALIIWSISGLVLVFVPLIGTACSTVGLIQGVLALRMQSVGPQPHRALPFAAVVIGGMGILWFFFSLFVYIMAGHGWFKVSGG
jgi:hypothetical protein